MLFQVARLSHGLGYVTGVLALTTSEEGVGLHLLFLPPRQENRLPAQPRCHLAGNHSCLPLAPTAFLCYVCGAGACLEVYLTEGVEPDGHWKCWH